jgi:hypothetical protein
MEQGNVLEEPQACPMAGDPMKPCKSKQFVCSSAKCTDYQEVKVRGCLCLVLRHFLSVRLLLLKADMIEVQ